MSYYAEFSDLQLPFGQLADGTLVGPSAVPRGAACGCVCPGCGAALIAKQGEVLRHHFAHASDAECVGALETSLHKLAKQIIAEASKIWLPEFVVRYPDQWHGERFVIERRVCAAHWNGGHVRVEVAHGDFRPDVMIEFGGRSLGIEVFVTHAVDAEKRAKIQAANLSAIEIDLSGYPRSFEMAALRDFVLRDASRLWIHHADQAAEHDLAMAEFHAEFSRRQQAESKRYAQEFEKRAKEWGDKWDTEHSPEARLKRRREADFAAAKAAEAAKKPTDAKGALAADMERREKELAGWRRAALIRPSYWDGAKCYPSPGAFCGSCGSAVFARNRGGWSCQGCNLTIFAELVA